MTAELSHTLTYVGRVARMRHFCWALVVSDLHSRYRNSLFGMAWALARPAGLTAVIGIVFSNVFHVPLREYAPYLFVSIVLWQFLVEAMLSGCQTFRTAMPYIRQQPVPLAVFPLRTVVGASVHAAFGLGASLLLTAACTGLPPVSIAVAALPGVLLVFLTGLALATLLGVMQARCGDTQHVVELGLQGLFYLTPVMYRADAFAHRGRLSWLIDANPLAALLDLVRQPLLAGAYPSPAHFLRAGAFLVVVGVLAWWCLRRFERTLVYWI